MMSRAILRCLAKLIEIQRNICQDISVEDELLTVEEAADRIKMHPVTIRRLLREGQLPGRKVGVRQWRISAASLKAFMEADRSKGTDGTH